MWFDLLVGGAKNHQIELDERGYDGSGKTVCRDHVRDEYLVDLLTAEAIPGECALCQKESEDQFPLEGILREFMALLHRDGWVPSPEWLATAETFDLLHDYLGDDVFEDFDLYPVFSLLAEEIEAWDWR